MNDIYRVSADGGTPMAVSADRFTQEYWARRRPRTRTRIAFTGAAARVDDGGGKGHSHLDESQIWLVHLGGESPHVRGGHEGRARNAWPMWSGDGKTLYFVSDRGGAREHLDEASRRRRRAAAHDVHRRPRALADDRRTTARRSCSSATSASGRSTSRPARRREVPITLRGASAVAGRRASDAHARAFSGSRCRPTERRSRSPCTARSSRRRRATAARRRASRPRRSSRAQLAWAPDSRRLVYASSSRRREPPLSLRFRRAQRRPGSPTAGANDVAPRGRRTARASRSCAAAKELRVLDVGDEAGPRARHGPARPAAVPRRAADRLVARRQVDRLPRRRRGPVSES